jgi:ABC-2 type transport system ATP-binding protein
MIRVLGLPPGEPSGLRRVGAMGETAFYPFLSGRDNLRAAARRCKVKDARVDAVLDVAGLTARAGDRVSAYSLGMTQRLAVAAAMLKDPELLILDEPSNGLDPIGQLEMRRLIRELADGGCTILLSSHDMREVEELCGRVAVIGGGRMLSEGTPEQLRGQARLWVRAKPAQQAAALVAELASRNGANLQGAEQAGELLNVAMRETGPSQAAAVNRQLVEAGLEVSEVRTERRPLRDVFLELTDGRSGGADSLRQPAGRRRRRRRAGRAPDEVH